MTTSRPAEIRFWEKVERGEGCWLWTASTRSSGYGSFWDGERRVSAHRWAFESVRGPIPEGLVLDHLCRVRLCVRPDHLEPVTNRENLFRGAGITAENVRKMHCPVGHEYTAENTYTDRRGRRTCKACKRLAAAHHRRSRNRVA